MGLKRKRSEAFSTSKDFSFEWGNRILRYYQRDPAKMIKISTKSINDSDNSTSEQNDV